VTYDAQSGINIVGYGTVNGERHGLIRGLTSTVPEPNSMIIALFLSISLTIRNYTKKIK
jgi:hypothetical protein